MKVILVTLAIIFSLNNTWANGYPAHWWEFIPESQRQASWEILPHEAKKGELILSKRNELGVFSNLAHAPFFFEGSHYASIEALWQMMKYPDLSDKKDPRIAVAHLYPYQRTELYDLHGFESKKAGDAANAINKQYGFKLVSYKKKHFDYKDMSVGSNLHYQIIKKAIKAKVEQNPAIKKLLMQTKGLVLKPDHKQGLNLPKSYYYHEILMEIRDN